MEPAATSISSQALSSTARLQAQSTQLQSWFNHQPGAIQGFTVRKYAAWLEPQCFLPADENTAYDRARFDLMINTGRDIWSITLDMVFYLKPRVTVEGIVANASVLFTVLDEDNRPKVVDYLPVWENAITEHSAENTTPEQWITHWFRKLTKSRRLPRIFACKTWVRELD